MSRSSRIILLAVIVMAAVALILKPPAVWRFGVAAPVALISNPRTSAEKIVNGAKREVLRGVRYDAAYLPIDYPNGDVPRDQGACTDVIVRALRAAGCDLQREIHKDMTRNFPAYPRDWGLSAPDSNIDHRRVSNHLVFLKRHGRALPLGTTGADAKTWRPGDLVYWRLTPSRLTHCGVLSNDRNSKGLPLVLHNIGPTASQQDCLEKWEIIGHFRYPVR